MMLQEIYDLAISMAMQADPRGEKRVKEILVKRKKAYDVLSDKEKKYFDTESLNHPYADSRILYGDPGLSVKKVIAGIDTDTPEVLLVDRLREKGEKIDLIITHHPNGAALAGLHETMELEVEMVHKYAGVPLNVAQALLEARQGWVGRRFKPLNHMKPIQAARLLDVPILALHTASDNLFWRFMQDLVEKSTAETVGELWDEIMELPEFQQATTEKAGPYIVSGRASSRLGNVFVGGTGGTDPDKELYVEMAKAGMGTLLDMHVNEDTLKELQKLHVNVIDLGHISSDSLGLNLFLDRLEKQGIDVVSFGGLLRVKR